MVQGLVLLKTTVMVPLLCYTDLYMSQGESAHQYICSSLPAHWLGSSTAEHQSPRNLGWQVPGFSCDLLKPCFQHSPDGYFLLPGPSAKTSPIQGDQGDALMGVRKMIKDHRKPLSVSRTRSLTSNQWANTVGKWERPQPLCLSSTIVGFSVAPTGCGAASAGRLSWGKSTLPPLAPFCPVTP